MMDDLLLELQTADAFQRRADDVIYKRLCNYGIDPATYKERQWDEVKGEVELLLTQAYQTRINALKLMQ